MLQPFNVRHVFCGACTGQEAPFLKPQAWSGVRVRENDRVGSEPFKPSEPIKAAINHHLCTTI